MESIKTSSEGSSGRGLNNIQIRPTKGRALIRNGAIINRKGHPCADVILVSELAREHLLSSHYPRVGPSGRHQPFQEMLVSQVLDQVTRMAGRQNHLMVQVPPSVLTVPDTPLVLINALDLLHDLYDTISVGCDASWLENAPADIPRCFWHHGIPLVPDLSNQHDPFLPHVFSTLADTILISPENIGITPDQAGFDLSVYMKKVTSFMRFREQSGYQFYLTGVTNEWQTEFVRALPIEGWVSYN